MERGLTAGVTPRHHADFEQGAEAALLRPVCPELVPGIEGYMHLLTSAEDVAARAAPSTGGVAA